MTDDPNVLGKTAIALGMVKNAFALLKTLSGASPKTEIDEKVFQLKSWVSSLQDSLIDMQLDYKQLLDVKERIEKELAKCREWEEEKAKYELVSLTDGLVAVRRKPALQGSEPQHYLCACCFEKGAKSFLLRTDANKPTYHCHACGFKCDPVKRNIQWTSQVGDDRLDNFSGNIR
jgi:hypothetical protein